ncbi:hypothetical protein QYE76_032378 [Lolium multiflorum]|uniref:Uncharacterized protein n=1 Tax=Lolium multiflorum TaxID=4521 RepID=A0AAD8VL42_LOLMU|nr:hypothetical protein QYE76_032378 [Lolium multiflorum]
MAVVTDDNQGTSRPESEAAGSRKSAASSEKDAEAEATSSTRSPPSAASPRSKRKRDEAVDTGTSKPVLPAPKKLCLMLKRKLWICTKLLLLAPVTRCSGGDGGDDDEDDGADDGDDVQLDDDGDGVDFPSGGISPADSARRRALFSLVSPPRRAALSILRNSRALEKLAEANKRADALAAELEQSETARMKAEADAATVEDLQKRLDDAKKALEENVAQHSAREEEILNRLESQSRRFVRRTHQEYELENPEGDQLLDALSLLEIHGTEARDGLAEAEIGLSRLFPYFFKKKEEPAIFIDLAKCFTSDEDLGLQLRQEGLKVGVEGTIALVANSQQNVDWTRVGDAEDIETKKWQSLIKAAKPNSKKILATLGYKPAPAPSSSKPEVK